MHSSLRTPLCDMLGIEVPILQAGMGYVARGELAGATAAGQCSGGIRDIPTVREVMRRLVEETEAALARLCAG